MWLKTRMFFLIALLFAILYGVITIIGLSAGIGNAVFYIFLAIMFMTIQYLISPAIVGWSMKVKWVSEAEAPELHQMVAELAREAHLPKPKVGISETNIPNAFAYGRTQKDARICVTRGILDTLNEDELRAVLGHEMAHIQHRDMIVITLLSVVPLILYWVGITLTWGSMLDDRERGDYGLIGIGALILYYITNLLVLYGSRIREYYADKGSVQLGNKPYHLASALYKLTRSDVRFKGSKELKKVEVAKAFFVNDPSRSWQEVRDVVQIDRNLKGSIDYNDLMELRTKKVHLGFGANFVELFSTHPNMLRRIKHLSSLMS